MTNNSIANARAAIVTILQTVTQLEQVAYGRTTNISGGFPFCRVYFDGLAGKWEDQQSWYATYVFQIEVIQEIAAKSKADAEADLEDVVYYVIRALVSGWQLSNNADDTEIQASPARELEIPQGPAVSMQITLNVRSLIY